MPSPYTIEQTADMSGLSIKFIRRLKAALPELFEKNTERGQSNALLFNEELVEVLKRTRELQNRGRTLQQIRDELASVAGRPSDAQTPQQFSDTVVRQSSDVQKEDIQLSEHGKQGSVAQEETPPSKTDPLTPSSLRRENELLRTQVTFLQELIRRSEARFDRLLPSPIAANEPMKKQGLKTQLLLWLVEAAVVTVFAAGFIFMIWLFAQKAFTL